MQTLHAQAGLGKQAWLPPLQQHPHLPTVAAPAAPLLAAAAPAQQQQQRQQQASLPSAAFAPGTPPGIADCPAYASPFALTDLPFVPVEASQGSGTRVSHGCVSLVPTGPPDAPGPYRGPYKGAPLPPPVRLDSEMLRLLSFDDFTSLDLDAVIDSCLVPNSPGEPMPPRSDARQLVP